MISDFHLHTSFSGDSEAAPEAMVRQAIRLGLPSMCFTDHYDIDYPDEPELFLFDIDQYAKTMQNLQEQYKSQIDIRIGIELGLQKHLSKECQDIVSSFPFDFIIGSSHVINHKDPYYPEFFEGRDEASCYGEYFNSILDNLGAFNDVDVYGHIDYIVRYGPNKNRHYSYYSYRNIIDEILVTCIRLGIGLEINTGGLAYGLGHPNPHPDILKRYRELGGEIITIGSDAHTPNRIAYEFHQAGELLKACGFHYYTIFANRTPSFVKL